MATYNGSIEELRAITSSLGHEGEWKETPNSTWRFVRKDRGGMNWSQTKGTLWFDGPGPAQETLKKSIETALAGDGELKEFDPTGKTIFVVHGRDHVTRDQLQLVLYKLGLQPFVLQDTGGGGKTIIEALEKMIGKKPASAFGIVLVTPDDMGYLKDDGQTEAKPRAPKRDFGIGNAAEFADQGAGCDIAKGSGRFAIQSRWRAVSALQ